VEKIYFLNKSSFSLSLSLSREKEEQLLHGRNHGEKSWLGWELKP
jgi:hypothetical protein